MKGSVIDLSGRDCYLYKDSKAEFLLIQPIDGHDLEVLDHLTGQEVKTTLEWNPGNHFVDSDKRTAKGFAWAICIANPQSIAK